MQATFGTGFVFSGGGGITLTSDMMTQLSQGKELVIRLVAGRPLITLRNPAIEQTPAEPLLETTATTPKGVAAVSTKGSAKVAVHPPTLKGGRESAARTPPGRGRGGNGRGGTTPPAPSAKQKKKKKAVKASVYNDPQVAASMKRLGPRIIELSNHGLDVSALSVHPDSDLSELTLELNTLFNHALATNIVSKESTWNKFVKNWGGLKELVSYELGDRITDPFRQSEDLGFDEEGRCLIPGSEEATSSSKRAVALEETITTSFQEPLPPTSKTLEEEAIGESS